MVIPCLLTGSPSDPSVHDTAGFYGSILPGGVELHARAAVAWPRARRSRRCTSLHEAEAAELLGIPDTVTQVALMPVAYTIGDDFKPADRRPVGDVTY